MKLLKSKLHIINSILILFVFSTASGQDDSWRFMKKNPKLNRNYVQDLNSSSSSLFINTSRNDDVLDMSRKKKLNILVIPQDDRIRFANPDAMEIQYHYRDFNLGNLLPQVFRPADQNPENIIRPKNKAVNLAP